MHTERPEATWWSSVGSSYVRLHQGRPVHCRVKRSGGRACRRRDASSQRKEAERVVRTILPGGVGPHSPER